MKDQGGTEEAEKDFLCNMLFPFIFLVAIEMTFLEKGKNFPSPISQGQPSILQPSLYLGVTFDLRHVQGVTGERENHFGSSSGLLGCSHSLFCQPKSHF